MNAHAKPTNPKDAVGIKKWRYISTVPLTVFWEVGAALLEGARKYGRHNYRVAGVRASVYVDAAFGHIGQWWEGEDIDPDSGLSHITKAIASLTVLRDAMIQDMLEDDRPPRAKLGMVRGNLQAVVDRIFDDHPDARAAFTEKDHSQKNVWNASDVDFADDEILALAGTGNAALVATTRSRVEAGRLRQKDLERVLGDFGLSRIADAQAGQIAALTHALQAAERHGE
ncbi:hypothetical protein RCCWILLIS_67 [Rhodobacter phage RcCWillis]|nr:hypothetical protein RCCWILLIS_67 [Rhodobacter phage RcCWillis]